jgi:hypothetical protein
MFWSNEGLPLDGVGPPSHHSSSSRHPKQNFASADFSVVASSDLHFPGRKQWDVSGFHLRNIPDRSCLQLFLYCQALGWHATAHLQDGACD